MPSDEEVPVQLEKLEIPLVWVGAEELQILVANQFLIQVAENEVFLSAGQASPPALIGSNEEKLKQLEQIDYVPVQTLARFGLSLAKLRELSALLNVAVAALDRKTT